MTHDDDQLEHYLSDFQPRPLRPLQLPATARNPWLRRIAAVAVLSVCLGTGYWHFYRSAVIVQLIQPKSGAQLFTKIGLADPRKLDELLDNQSPNVLPELQGERSTLRVLAKE
jgi:hypothetical protein